MSMGIYCITNSANGKSYIGKSNDIDRRRTQHFSALENNEHDNEEMQRDYNKYGNDCFEFSILETVDDEYKLDYIEDYYIKKFDLLTNGYNRCRGNIKSVLNTNSFLRKPTLERVTSDNLYYSLQDLIKFHNKLFDENIGLSEFLHIYGLEDSKFFIYTSNGTRLYLSNADVEKYINKYVIFTSGLYVSNEVIDMCNKTEDKIADLFDEWNEYVRKRTKQILLNENNIIYETEIKIAKKFLALFEDIPISVFGRMEECMDYELQAILYFLNDLDVYDEKSTIETINHRGLELTI